MKQMLLILSVLMICLLAFSACSPSKQYGDLTVDLTAESVLNSTGNKSEEFIPFGTWEMYYENFPDSPVCRIILNDDYSVSFTDLTKESGEGDYFGSADVTADMVRFKLNDKSGNFFDCLYKYSLFEDKLELIFSKGERLPIDNVEDDKFLFYQPKGFRTTEEWIYEEPENDGKIYRLNFHLNGGLDYSVTDKTTNEVVETASGDYYARFLETKSNAETYSFNICLIGESGSENQLNITTEQNVTISGNKATAVLAQGDNLIKSHSKNDKLVFSVEKPE